MRVRSAIQRQYERRYFDTQLAASTLSQPLRITNATGQQSQHRQATASHNVGSNRGELEIHRLQQARDAIDNTIAILLDVHAHACQFAQFANRLWGNETATQ
jgi:hypothetical protein